MCGSSIFVVQVNFSEEYLRENIGQLRVVFATDFNSCTSFVDVLSLHMLSKFSICNLLLNCSRCIVRYLDVCVMDTRF